MTRENRRDKFNKILKELGEYFETPITALVNFCRELGASDDQIAGKMGITRQRVHDKYPKAEEGETK